MADHDLPTSVEVGPFRYEVSIDPDELAHTCRSEHADLMGHTNHRHLRIVLDVSLAPDMLAETLMHEVLHAVFEVNGLSDEWGAEREEAVVRRTSPMLVEVLRRNPELVAFVTAPR